MSASESRNYEEQIGVQKMNKAVIDMSAKQALNEGVDGGIIERVSSNQVMADE